MYPISQDKSTYIIMQCRHDYLLKSLIGRKCTFLPFSARNQSFFLLSYIYCFLVCALALPNHICSFVKKVLKINCQVGTYVIDSIRSQWQCRRIHNLQDWNQHEIISLFLNYYVPHRKILDVIAEEIIPLISRSQRRKIASRAACVNCWLQLFSCSLTFIENGYPM